MSYPTQAPLQREQGRALALAGLVQAAVAVHAIAHGRVVEETKLVALLRTIFVTNPDSLDDIFPSVAPFREGIGMANDMLSAPAGTPAEPLRYSVVLLDIEKQLRMRRSVVDRLGEGLGGLKEPSWSEPITEDLFRRLSELYQNTISTLSRRVEVTGDPQQLRREDVAARVRSLLLAGVRLAWLWHQLGGRRWHLVMRRSNIRHALAQLDQHVSATPLH